MKLKIFTLSLLACPLLFSCDHLSEHAGHGHNPAAEMPQLNHGKRWKADSPTLEGFARLRNLVPRDVNPAEGIQAYNARAKRINGEIDAILGACRMTGDAHTELHKFISLLLQHTKAMAGSDLESVRSAQKTLSADLDRFSAFFE